MKRIKKLSFLFACAMLGLTGCGPVQYSNVNQPVVGTSNSNVSTNVASNTQSSEPPARVAALPVTMPLLDAMFTDEAFDDEAKKAIQITDDEMTKIRDAARNAVLQLNRETGDDEARSTRSSVEKTQKEIEKILGAERANTFLSFVRMRWAGGGELEFAKPNSVPTDTRIVVNAPAYRMDLFRDGQLVKTYKIGIGYPEFPLPTGLRRANEIIFNPTWTPPDEPWVKGKIRPYEKVEAGSKLNPLGPIKIPIGLPSLIHGGKDAARLGTFASHGCVGLTNAMVQDFAVQLVSLSGTDLTAEDVTGFAKDKTKTEEVELSAPMPVELRYETILVEDGKVTVFRDVYERGTNTKENLQSVLESFGVTLDSLPETDRTKLLDALQQMAVDAQGDAVSEQANSNSANNDKSNSNSSKVTRNVKGKKEIVVEITALKGKGYPAPVALRAK